MNIKNSLLIIIMMFTSNVLAYPYETTLEWISPAGDTGREDGTPLTSEEIGWYKIYTQYPGISDEWFQPMYTPMDLDKEINGYSKAIKVYVPTCFKLHTVDVNERESQDSNVVCISEPNAPAVMCQ